VPESAAGAASNAGLVTRPAVTVVVAAYNHERFVEQCLDSVAGQTFDDFETIIMDDCSTDRTVQRIEAWLDKTPFSARLLVNDRNRGVCATFNRAIRHSRGEFISIVSADDYYEPDKLERQHSFAEQLDGSVAAVFSNMRVVDEVGRESGLAFPSGSPPADGRIFERLIAGNFVPGATVMVRRAALQGVGDYDESLVFEDYDMWLRLADRYELRFLSGVVVNCRIVDSSLSRNPAHAGARDESRARLLLKWYGRSPRTDEVVLRRALRNGLRALATDRVRGRRVLEAVCATRPSLGRRVGVALAAVPGADKVLAGMFVVTDKLRASARDLDASYR
jgi:glycosyltransferase involved in cell wall biosynthesis